MRSQGGVRSTAVGRGAVVQRNAAASGHWAPVWGHLLWPDHRDPCQGGPQACPKGPSSATEMETWRTVFHHVTLKLT